jgi:hypothetical protein
VSGRRWIAAAYAAVVVASGIGARYPADWWLENLVVFAAAGGVALAWRRGFVFSESSFVLLALFGALHAYGAHHTYSETPLGNALRDSLGLARNPYDRIVHFAFGLLLAAPLRELALRAVGARGAWSYAVPLAGALCLLASRSSGAARAGARGGGSLRRRPPAATSAVLGSGPITHYSGTRFVLEAPSASTLQLRTTTAGFLTYGITHPTS